jgi:flagellar protein FlaI
MERIRNQHGQSKEEMLDELSRRVEVLDWMKENNIRAFKDVARIVSSYLDTPDDVMEKVRKGNQAKQSKITVENVMGTKQDDGQLKTPSDTIVDKK